MCCQVDVPASDSSLVQRIPTDCGVSEWDRDFLDNGEPLAHWGAVAPW